jgi:DNA-binding transcriptional LysR family regulator
MGNRMDTLYLERFLIVAEQKSFTKAANQLFLSTSTVSKSVVYLEESLGVKLLNRSNQSVELTKCGELLVDRGKELIKELKQLKAELNQLMERPGNTLNIFRVTAFSPSFLAAYRRYSNQYPDDIVQIYTHTPTGVAKALESGIADAGLIVDYDKSWEKQGFQTRVLGQDRYCAVVSMNHPFAERREIVLDDLAGERILALSPNRPEYSEAVSQAHTRLLGLLMEHQANVTTFNSDETLMFQLRAGLGISILGKPAALELYPDMRHIDLVDFDSYTQIFLAWKQCNGNPALTQFLELI